MGFNNGFEHVRLENKWKKLRIQYREAGMSEEAIQEMVEILISFHLNDSFNNFLVDF